jgi:ABC-2 type transport system permease protein
MNKISLIIQREYLSRVKKKSFIIMTLLGPILMAAVFIVPVLIGMKSHSSQNIMVLDETGWFTGKFKNDNGLTFKAFTGTQTQGKDSVQTGKFSTLLYIAKPSDNSTPEAIIYSIKQPDLTLKESVSSTMEKIVEKIKFAEQGISEEAVKAAKANVNVTTINITQGGKEEKSSTELAMGLGYITAMIIYMFIFIYGVQVMKGVIEEKTNRIVEVIISSVKPFELMMGKILGIALVGLTQFLLWVFLTIGIVGVFKMVVPDKPTPIKTEQSGIANNNTSPNASKTVQANAPSPQKQVGNDFMASLKNINFALELSMFLFFFLGGYLLYAALFAAVGAAVDNETDTQQFMLPITVPLILSIVAAQAIIQNPDGPLAFWLSIFPLTSPIVMMVRLPFHVPAEQIALSMGLLVLGFLGATWVAAKVYRIGILMYGKKVDYKELWKWIKYKG